MIYCKQPVVAKLDILTVLVEQLLTFATVRAAIESLQDQLYNCRVELKHLQAAEKKRRLEETQFLKRYLSFIYCI